MQISNVSCEIQEDVDREREMIRHEWKTWSAVYEMQERERKKVVVGWLWWVW